MIIGTCVLTLRIEWAESLKDKRAVVKGVTERARNKFNISIAEIESQDAHKVAVLGFACVTNETRHAQSIIQNVVSFIESSTDAEVTDAETEIL